MSNQTTTHQLHFTPLHRTVQCENIHEQVSQNDSQQQQQQEPESTPRKTLTRYMTVIGDGSDLDTCELSTR